MESKSARRNASIGALALAAAEAAGAEVVETRNVEENLTVDDPASLIVEVDNVFGSVTVTGHDGSTVEMSAVETIRAETTADIARARSETRLATEREGDRIAFRVRSANECECGDNRWRRWDDYIVEYDIELRVPRSASYDVATVNAGDVRVEGVHGDFRARNVNGAVTLEGLQGAGRAETVNGRIEATFERAPQDDTAFKTVNGSIEVEFPPELSADLTFKTSHGEIWTDFDVVPVPTAPMTTRSEDDGKSVIRSELGSAVRVGTGGPRHSFETLNGDIYVVETRP